MKRDTVVVGGGAIGVCCALELARRGARVTLYERGPALASGCSAGNAGLVCPSHSTPIANPVSLRNGLRWMAKRDSPFYLRPRPAVLPWLTRFALASRHWEEGASAIRELTAASLELHARLGAELGTSFERTGTLSVHATPEGLEAEARAAARTGFRGYRVDYAQTEDDPRLPVWLQETWTVATPFRDRLRLAGTLELAGLDLSISERRVGAIRAGGERWLRRLRGRPVLDTWAGLRPCLPDGLPAIGRLGRAVVATGHAMKGVALAPVTGRLVAQLVAGEPAEHDLTPFRPDRFRVGWRRT